MFLQHPLTFIIVLFWNPGSHGNWFLINFGLRGLFPANSSSWIKVLNALVLLLIVCR